jgi:hypothetical protein
LTKKAYHECPRFMKCSVNNCPLHPSFPEIYTDPDDFQVKCKLEKEVRLKIGSNYPDLLKYQGLTPQEWAGKKSFEGLSDQDKEIVRERARRSILSACETDVPIGGVRLPTSQVHGNKSLKVEAI